MGRRLSAVEVQQHLSEYTTYDTYVDVVSIFQWLMTETRELPGTVKHFERFPRINQGDKELTPDFTILFDDGHAVVGEIASVALHENSHEKLVTQLGNYAGLHAIPAGPRAIAKPVLVDVLLLVQADRGQAAFKGIRERIDDPSHPYSPTRPPVVCQYMKTDDRYIIQRLQNAGNGTLDPGSREHHLGKMLDNDFSPKAHMFTPTKVNYRFINDAASDLYLATHLLQQTFPTEYAGRGDEVDVVPSAVAQLIRQQYGGGVRSANVKRALQLLQKAGYARPVGGGSSWTVSLKKPNSRKQSQVHEIILDRASRGAGSVLAPLRDRPIVIMEQESLF